jgi:C_GCAxxG_C_C family probable redox protein
VFSAVAEQMGMDYQTAVKLSSGFGGGMHSPVCGAVSGGVMAIGLKHGGLGMEAQVQTAKTIREFIDRFKSLHKSINCPDLVGIDLAKLGIDLTRPETLKAAMEKVPKDAFTVCPAVVADAAKIVSGLVGVKG